MPDWYVRYCCENRYSLTVVKHWCIFILHTSHCKVQRVNNKNKRKLCDACKPLVVVMKKGIALQGIGSWFPQIHQTCFQLGCHKQLKCTPIPILLGFRKSHCLVIYVPVCMLWDITFPVHLSAGGLPWMAYYKVALYNIQREIYSSKINN
jgi:hypothetical protein